ncbi:MAG: heavy metal-binding domain-containing protein [Candidatus Coatesbacteria bacterium]
MKNLRFVLVGLAAGLVSATVAYAGEAGHNDEEHAKGTEVTLQGEVIDLYCFTVHPETGKGPDHAACASMCINKGLPIGFLAADGTVYLLLGQGHESIKGKVAKLAGYPAELKGVVIEHDGIKAIQMSSIKRVKAAAAAPAPAQAPAAATAPATPAKEVWACPMGCATSDKPGKCPHCGMTLEKKKS